MDRNPRKLLTYLSVGILIVGLGIFVYSRVHSYLRGPHVISSNLKEPQFIDTYSFSFTATVGQTDGARINGIEVPITEGGEITSIIPLTPGANTISLTLVNTFDKKVIYQYHVVTPPSSEIYPSLYTEAVESNTEEEEEVPPLEEDNLNENVVNE